MITLAALAGLAETFEADLDLPVQPLSIGGKVFDCDRHPMIMGCVNLSPDSSYRESIAQSADAAVRRGRVLTAQGADIVDIGAESSTVRAARVGPADQIAALTPVVRRLAAEGTTVSVESYEPQVVRAALEAGAQVVNFTGARSEREVFALAAEHGATVVICCVRGDDVREVTDVTLDADPVPGLLAHFERRVEIARALGVEQIVIDPGMGFYYGNLVDPGVRLEHQTRVLLNSFRLRRLGLPICHAVPHALQLFEDQFRTAEGFFAVLAVLGGTSMLRTHEVPHLRAVLAAMSSLTVA